MAWYRPTVTALGTVVSLGDTAGTGYLALGQDGTGRVFLEANGADAFATGTMTLNLWSHLCGVTNSATSRLAYRNGIVGAADTASQSPAGLDRTTVNTLMNNGTRISASSGDIAHFAVWNVALSAGVVAALAAGTNPLEIPTGLVGYWPIEGDVAPEPDVTGLAFPLVINGSAPQAATDPPVIPPGGMFRPGRMPQGV